MAKNIDFKRITVEDFPQENQTLIEKLAFPINSFFEQVRNAFNKNITVDNLAEERITLRVQTNDSGTPLNTLSFKTGLSRVVGVRVLSASVVTPVGTYLQTTPFISFSQNSSIITINNIAGLGSNITYDLLLEVKS